MVDNIKRDPFEGAVGDEMKTLLGQGGPLAGPVTAYLYDWNIKLNQTGANLQSQFGRYMEVPRILILLTVT